MPRGGHNAKPTEVLKLHGTYDPYHHANRGPKTGGEPLRKPDDLGPDASAHWDMILRTRSSWLCSSDAAWVERLCVLWELSQRCYRLLQDDPTSRDARCSANAYHAEWAKLACRIGLNPADRARLGEGSDVHQAKDEIEEMLG